MTQKLLKLKKKKLHHNHDKYITTQELNKLMTEKSITRLSEGKLATNIDVVDFVKMTDVDEKLKAY